MTSNLTRYKADLDKLSKLGSTMALDLDLRYAAQGQKLSNEYQEFGLHPVWKTPA